MGGNFIPYTYSCAQIARFAFSAAKKKPTMNLLLAVVSLLLLPSFSYGRHMNLRPLGFRGASAHLTNVGGKIDWNTDPLAPLYKFKLPYERTDGSKGTACYAQDQWVEPPFTKNLQLSKNYLKHLASLGPISKKIHLVWNGPNLLTKLGDVGLVKYGVGGLKKLNPGECLISRSFITRSFPNARLGVHDLRCA